MPTVELTLPWPPTVNTYYRHVGAKVLISASGRRYRGAVAVATLLRGRHGLPLAGRLRVSILANPPDRRARDLDNLLKGLLDALQHAHVYEDDSQIDDLAIRRGDVYPGGCVTVTLENLA